MKNFLLPSRFSIVRVNFAIVLVFSWLLISSWRPVQGTVTVAWGATGTVEAAVGSISAEELAEVVSFLAHPEFQGREAGTPAAQKAAAWIAQQLEQMEISPAGVDGQYFQPFGDGFSNVLAILPGDDPELAGQVIVVGAHFDHIGFGRKRDSGQVHPGADDNATGVAAVLELAEAFRHFAPPRRRTLLFAFWDAEEKGLLGSKQWVNNPTVPLESVVLALNFDMIGRLREDRVHLVGVRSGLGWRRLFVLHNPGDLYLVFSWSIRPDSDHIPFFNAGIPSVMFHTGLHEDYHKPTDTADRINYAGMERIVRYAFFVIYDLTSRENLPSYRPEAKKEEAPEWPAEPVPRLGVRCQASKENGRWVEIVEVLPGSPAEQAGIRAQDRILRVDGREHPSWEDLLTAVSTAEKEVSLLVQSQGQEDVRKLTVALVGPPMPFGLILGKDEADPEVALVLGVVPASPAALAGIREGDRIWEVSGHSLGPDPVGRLAELIKTERQANPHLSVVFTLERDGRRLRIAVPDPSRN